MPYVKNEERERRNGVSAMICKCGGPTQVKDTRTAYNATTIRRTRRCLSCGSRWPTWEVTETEMEMISAFKALKESLGRL